MTDFVERFGGIYEHSPWVAAEAELLLGAEDDMERLAAVMADCVDNASSEKQLALIRAHPDLAGRAQVAAELTAESALEQSSAGLDQCSEEEWSRFQALNDAYWERFGFPFVMAVRDSSRAEILDAFESRLHNDRALEFETALQEIHRIARLRLAAMAEPA
jgi:OHCU decarboxylase